MILDTIQCPLCETYICEDWDNSYGTITPAHSLLVYRWDLLEYVCLHCDMTLGPDNKRVQAMQLCKDTTILTEYLARYTKTGMQK